MVLVIRPNRFWIYQSEAGRTVFTDGGQLGVCPATFQIPDEKSEAARGFAGCCCRARFIVLHPAGAVVPQRLALGKATDVLRTLPGFARQLVTPWTTPCNFQSRAAERRRQ